MKRLAFLPTILLMFLPMLALFATAQTTITMDYTNTGNGGSFCFSPGARCQVSVPPNASPQQVMTSDSSNSVYGCPTINYSDGHAYPGLPNGVRFSGCASPVDEATQDDGSITTTFTIDNLRAYDPKTKAFVGLVTGSLPIGNLWGYAINVKHGRSYSVTTAHGSFTISPAQ